MELVCAPAHSFASLLGHLAWVPACQLSKRRNLAIALDELDRNIEVQQTSECLAGHWAGKQITPDHDLVYLFLTNGVEYSLQCREISVNIVDGSDPHDLILRGGPDWPLNAIGR
jgi:hypothetical protein